MKIILSGLAAIFGIAGNSYSQAIDTVQTFDYGKMPPVYFSNKLYWEKNYDKDNHLLFEALKYNTCYTGAFINYWENGKVKTKGQYMKNASGNWASLQSRGLCSVQDGEWKNYNRAGQFINTVLYKKGTIVKEEKKENTAFVMCEILPGIEVAQYSPFTVPYVSSAAWPISSYPQGCRYGFEDKGKRESGSIAIGITDFKSKEEAQTSHRNHDQMVRDNWNAEPEKIDGLGETASFSGDNETGLQVVTGTHILDVNIGGQFPDVTAAQKRKAAIVLAKLVLERLPQLARIP